MYKTIAAEIRKQLRQGKQKFAIYPYGKVGKTTKQILEMYGVNDIIIVDNELCKKDDSICSLKEVKDHEEYTWLIACTNPDVFDVIEQSIESLIPRSNIVFVVERPIARYGEEYKRIKEIGKSRPSNPCFEFLEIIKKKKIEGRRITVAEIGLGAGSTAVAACKLLDEKDCYYAFDFEDVVEELVYDLKKLPNIRCNIIGKGNTYKTYDSYNWNLCNLLLEMRNEEKEGLFDVVYLDGPHTLLHDGLACCLLKELLKKDGYIVFDDMNWSFADSPRHNPFIEPSIMDDYTDEQIEACQVRIIVNTFMIHDKSFEEVFVANRINHNRAIFRKL